MNNQRMMIRSKYVKGGNLRRKNVLPKYGWIWAIQVLLLQNDFKSSLMRMKTEMNLKNIQPTLIQQIQCKELNSCQNTLIPILKKAFQILLHTLCVVVAITTGRPSNHQNSFIRAPFQGWHTKSLSNISYIHHVNHSQINLVITLSFPYGNAQNFFIKT